MAEHWFFAWDANRFGPFTEAELKHLAMLGRLQPTDTVWKEGVANGVAAHRIKNLFSRPAEPIPMNASPGVSSPIPSADESLPPSNAPATSEEQLQGIIPDGLTLRPMAGQIDTPPLPSPVTKTPDTRVDVRPKSSSETSAAAQEPATTGHTNMSQPGPFKEPSRKKRAVGVKGVVILTQDGEVVRYRKKCDKCGAEDSCTRAVTIKSGPAIDRFFCPHCRKLGRVEIRGVS